MKMKNYIINEYYDVVSKINEVRTQEKELKQMREAHDDNYPGLAKDIDVYKEWSAQKEVLNEKIKICGIEISILTNNLLAIQQELLKGFLELYKTKYIKKPIGEKTKEKIQNEFKEYVKTTYGISVYPYINQKNDWGKKKTELSIYYEDFYYEYVLKQEKMIYQNETDENYLYYYREIEYVELDKVGIEAQFLYSGNARCNEEVKKLQKKIDEIKARNNSLCKGSLDYLRIK